MMKKMVFLYGLITFTSLCTAQVPEYKYRREIKGVEDTWHKILLPDDIFSKLTSELSDVRILRIDGRDTTESPYIISGNEPQRITEIPFELINRSSNDSGYYVTFQLQHAAPINHIQLHIGATNFDWLTNLEGSHDNQSWFALLKDYRISALQNDKVSFKFDRLFFPAASYRYFRLLIRSKTDPLVNGASLIRSDSSLSTSKIYTANFSAKRDRQAKLTILNLELKDEVPVSRIRLIVKDTVDYLRQVIIEQLVDSFKIEKGWQYHFRTVHVGALHSQSSNEFNFPVTIARKFVVNIVDSDNSPLEINKAEIEGPQYVLTTRFNKGGKHFLFYGNTEVASPEYDIKHFIERVPENARTVKLGAEELVGKVIDDGGQPLFMNKLWLWILLLLIVAVLGWFSVKMLRDRSADV